LRFLDLGFPDTMYQFQTTFAQGGMGRGIKSINRRDCE
jgi:hypothetical protein